MAYTCNVASCQPCKHVESVVKCPDCGKQLIIAPHHKWVYCRDWYGCQFEMTPEKFERLHERLPELEREDKND